MYVHVCVCVWCLVQVGGRVGANKRRTRPVSVDCGICEEEWEGAWAGLECAI